MLKNTTKVWLIILLFSIALMFFNYWAAGRLGLFIGLFLAIVLNIFIFIYGDGDINKRLHSQVFSGNDPWQANQVIKKLSAKLNMSPPTFRVMHSRSESSYCGWQTYQGGFICLSDSILSKYSSEEIEALIAQQLCFLKVTDTVRHRLASIATNTILGCGYFIDGLIPVNFFPEINKSFFLKPFSWLGYLILKLAYRPGDYLTADSMSVELLNSRNLLSKVIWKIENSSFYHKPSLPPCTSYMFVTYPFGQYKDKKFLISQPPIDLRLEKLLGYFPL